MTPRTLAILGVVTLATAGLAAWTLTRQSARVASREQGGPAFPGLGEKANDVAAVRVVRGKDEITVNRAVGAGGEGWTIAQRGGYPAKPEKVREVVVALSELDFTERRTSNPASYAGIGVQDPAEGSESALVELKDAQGATLASLIVGNNKPGSGFIAEATFFARRAGEEQSWVARPGRGTQRLEASADPMQWVERNILGIGKERVKTVQVTHTDGSAPVTVTKDSKESTEFKVDGIPEGRELVFPNKPESIGSALAFVSFEEVRPGAEKPLGDPETVAEYRTFDGLVITIRGKKDGENTWVAFAVATGPAASPDESVTKEAADLHAKLSPWVFQVADFQAKNYLPRMDDLLKPLGGEAPPDLPPGVQGMNIPGLSAPPGPMGPAPSPPSTPQPPPADPSPVAPPP